MGSRVLHGAIGGILLIGMLAAPAVAQPSARVEGYAVTRFGTAEGAPLSAWTIAQTSDGFLWIGSAEGLHRFDGFEFEPWRSLSSNPLAGTRVRALRADARGGLWVGFENGGVSHIDAALHVRTFGERDGVRGTGVRAIASEASGRVWAGSRQGLFAFDGVRWRAEPQFAGTPVTSIYIDNAQLWVGTTDAIFRQRADRRGFDLIATVPTDGNGVQGLCDARGTMVRTDPQHGFSLVGTHRRSRDMQEQGIGVRVHCSLDGDIWVGTAFAGLWRASGDGASARLETGLLTEGVLALFEDRDQSLWVGGTDGIYRLIRRRMTVIDDVGVVAAIVADRDGSMWAGTLDGVRRYRHQRGEWHQIGRYVAGARIRSLHPDPSGGVWAATDGGVARITPQGLVTYPPWGSQLDQIESMTSDAHGALWLFDLRRGLIHMSGQTASFVAVPPELQGVPRTIVHVDRRNRLWIVNGTLAIELGADGMVLRKVNEPNDLSESDFRSVYEDDTGALWLGGVNSLSRIAGDRMQTVTIVKAPSSTVRVNAITQSAAGEIWVGTVGGIVRLDPAAFDRAAVHGNGTLGNTVPVLEGLPGGIRSISNHTAARSATGDMWFVTDEGIAIIAATPMPTPAVTSTRITRVDANEQAVPLVAGTMALEPDTSRIRIRFSALDLVAPHRQHFRYRLEGFDPDWLDAGAQRSADYTRLAPGQYVFHVVATREAAPAAGREATWSFTIAPHFYQTTWFPVSVALTLSGAALGAWRLRVTGIRRRFAIILGERTRVSREIHDTLLQGYVGVALDLEALALTSLDAPVKQRVLAIRRRVGDQIEDAREAIWHLRSPLLEQHDLAGAVQHVGEGLTAATGIRIELQQTGEAISGRSRAGRELFLVAQEALINAVRHGSPSVIAIGLNVDADAVTLAITDDGCGFNPDEQRAGRIGLASMRERIEALGGAFRISSGVGMGTQIQATVQLHVFQE